MPAFPLSTCSALLERCIALNSLSITESLHAHFHKLGIKSNTFFSNHITSLYSNSKAIDHALKVFHEIPNKNIYSYNVLLSGFVNSGFLSNARELFDEMPKRDIVSWNCMISGYASIGLVNEALSVWRLMQDVGVKMSAFTVSIAASCALTVKQAKEIHGSAMRNALFLSNTFLQNSLIDIYGRVGYEEYALSVFKTMKTRDIVSWNTVMRVIGDSGVAENVFRCFMLMKDSGMTPDEFTLSTLISSCTDIQDLAKGEQLLAHCLKMGCLLNSIIASSVIDMYSKCGRLDCSVKLFEELQMWNSAVCNSMASAYSFHGRVHEVQKLYVDAFEKDIRSTEFSFAGILSSSACFGLVEQGTEIHCLAIKMGLESELVVASALVDMYAKVGFADSAMKIFISMPVKDVVSWNAIIVGLARSGQGIQALRMFAEMQSKGHQPDKITLIGVLTACSHEGLVDEGKKLFSSMTQKFGIAQDLEHYACLLEMLGKAGRLREAMEFTDSRLYKPNALMLGILLEFCNIHRDFRLAEVVAERLMELKPRFSLPYNVLARIYESKGKWESMAKILIAMKQQDVKKARDRSWLSIKGQIFEIDCDQVTHSGGESLFFMLHYLSYELESNGYVSQQHDSFEAG